MKNSYQYQPFSKPLFYFIFALSVVIWVINIVLLVLEGIFGLIGFNNNTQISATCNVLTQTYYYVKYNSNLSTVVSLCFVFTLLAVAFSTALTIILLVLIIKMGKDEIVAFRKSVKVSIYVLCSLLIISITVPAGYYLAFTRELTQCAVTTYNSSQIQVIAIIAIIGVGLACLIWVLFIIYFYQRVSSQEKYRDVTSNQTEPQQKQKVQVYQREVEIPNKKDEVVYNTTHQREKARKDIYKHEETQQNLYQAPSKRKIDQYRKEPAQDIQSSRNNPVLQSRSPFLSQQKKYAPQRNYNREPDNNPGELVLMRERKNPTFNRDEQEYKQYQQQYRRNQGGRSILPLNGVEQRESKGSDYYRSGGSPPQRWSPSRNQKEGVLVKYIRGKYAV